MMTIAESAACHARDGRGCGGRRLTRGRAGGGRAGVRGGAGLAAAGARASPGFPWRWCATGGWCWRAASAGRTWRRGGRRRSTRPTTSPPSPSRSRGVLAMRLVESGVLDLDRPMASYERVGGVLRGGAGGRAAHLFRRLRLRPARDAAARAVDADERHARASASTTIPSPSPGHRGRSCRLTGRPFSDLVAEEVFAPAGMTESARKHRHLPLRADLAGAGRVPYHAGFRRRVRPLGRSRGRRATARRAG